MRSFGRRDPAAAEALYERFAPRVYGLGIVMLGNDAAAQDLVQDTFVKLWRGADRFDSARGKLDTWVLLVARSLAIDALRRRVLEARTAEAVGPAPEVAPERGQDPLLQLERRRDLVRGTGERAHALGQHGHVPPAGGAAPHVTADLEVGDLVQGPEQVLGEHLADLVTPHAVPPTPLAT